MQLSFRRAALALTCSAALLLPIQADAFDATGNPVADAFFANVEAGGVTDLAVGSVTGDADRTEIQNLTGTSNKNGEVTKITFGTLIFDNGAVDSDGRLSAARMTARNVIVDGDTDIRIGEAVVDDVVLPTADEIRNDKAAAGSSSAYHDIAVSDIVIVNEEGTMVPISSLKVDALDRVDGIIPGGTLEITGITINRDSIKDAEAAGRMAELGYDQLILDVTSVGRWDAATDKMILEKFTIKGQNAGELTITAELGSMTAAMLKTLQTASETNERMEVLQKLTLNMLSIRFDNASLAERMMDMQAKQMGTTRDQLVVQLSAALPMMLSALQNPDFQKMVAGAVTAFLKSPQSISAVAAPAQPVPAGQIMGAAMMAPQTLPTILAVEVKANQ